MTNNNFDIREWRMQQALKEFNELSDKQKKIALKGNFMEKFPLKFCKQYKNYFPFKIF